MTSQAAGEGYSVCVAVCTFRRNDRLAELVRRINVLAQHELTDGKVSMVIVDDSPEGGAAATVESLRSQVSLELTYRNTASADISTARNCALELAMERSDFVACLDDDCVPDAGWLGELVQTAEDRAADIVVGHHLFFAAAGAPDWLATEPFLEEKVWYPNGSVPDFGNTANLLIRSDWLLRTRVRFRSDLGKVGGEDMVFFADARAAGAEIRFAANSISREPCDGRRATFRYQIWRQCWLGNNEAVINNTTGAVRSSRLLLRGAKRVGLGLVHPVARLAQRKSPQWRWGAGLAGRGAGLLLGVCGLRLRHRS